MLLATPSSTISTVATPTTTGTTPQASYFTQYVDQNPNAPAGFPGTPGSQSGVFLAGSTTIVVNPPAGATNSGGSAGASATRTVTFFSVINLDTLYSLVLTVNLNGPNGTQVLKNAVTLLAGETLQYGSTSGFQILDINGFLKQTSTAFSTELRILQQMFCDSMNIKADDYTPLRTDSDFLTSGART